jgi:hypothetical protein
MLTTRNQKQGPHHRSEATDDVPGTAEPASAAGKLIQTGTVIEIPESMTDFPS